MVQGSFELSEQGQLTGHCPDVPFGRHCQSFLIVVDDSVLGKQQKLRLCLVDAVQVSLKHGSNICGEPSDALTIEAEIAGQRIFAVDRAWLDHGRLLGAAARAVMMAGALEEMLQVTVDYALERRQFGKAIAKFQAIQQQLAVFAGEVAASVRAADTLLVSDELSRLDVAIAKARIGEASGLSSEIAHQVHGAIGYTREHRLNQLSRRLWLWRDQFGNEHEWQQVVADAFLSDSGTGLWQKVTELKV
jgi:acyl-CoA dehydrogenase